MNINAIIFSLIILLMNRNIFNTLKNENNLSILHSARSYLFSWVMCLLDTTDIGSNYIQYDNIALHIHNYIITLRV